VFPEAAVVVGNLVNFVVVGLFWFVEFNTATPSTYFVGVSLGLRLFPLRDFLKRSMIKFAISVMFSSYQ